MAVQTNWTATVAFARRAAARGVATVRVRLHLQRVRRGTGRDPDRGIAGPPALPLRRDAPPRGGGLLELVGQQGFEPVLLRFGTVYGLSPRMRFDLVVNLLTLHAVRHGEISIFGGEQWRPFVHVGDIARALEMAMTEPLPAGRADPERGGQPRELPAPRPEGGVREARPGRAGRRSCRRRAIRGPTGSRSTGSSGSGDSARRARGRRHRGDREGAQRGRHPRSRASALRERVSRGLPLPVRVAPFDSVRVGASRARRAAPRRRTPMPRLRIEPGPAPRAGAVRPAGHHHAPRALPERAQRRAAVVRRLRDGAVLPRDERRPERPDVADARLLALLDRPRDAGHLLADGRARVLPARGPHEVPPVRRPPAGPSVAHDTPGIEVSAGSLGQGLSVCCGVALGVAASTRTRGASTA